MKAAPNRQWTGKDCRKIETLLRDGKSATEIGRLFGVSRNSIIGLVHRNPKLKAIGLAGKPGGFRPKSNVVPFPTRPVPAKPVPAEQPVPAASAPALRVLTNEGRLIEEWLAKNGGPRRFEIGASNDYFSMQRYLETHGYTLSQVAKQPRLKNGAGRDRRVTWTEVWTLVDKLRASEGLEPMRLANRRSA